MIEYRYTREFRRAAIAACAQKFTAVLNLVQPTGDQSKKTAVVVMATTAMAIGRTQQLSLLRIWVMSLFALANLPGAGDLRHWCAHVPWSRPPLLLRLSCLSVRCRWSVGRRSSAWARQLPLPGGLQVTRGHTRWVSASLGRLSLAVASLWPWSCPRSWARSGALLLPPCIHLQHPNSSSKSFNYALYLTFCMRTSSSRALACCLRRRWRWQA